MSNQKKLTLGMNAMLAKNTKSKLALSKLLTSLLLVMTVAACTPPAEKAEKYYQKGMSLVESDPDKARVEFLNALQLKKNMNKALYGLGLASERKGDWKGAFSFYNKVVEEEPNNVQALVKTGQILLAGQKIDMALERCNKALQIEKSNPDVLALRAAIELKLNNASAAVEYANLALQQNPKSQDAFVVLASERLTAKDQAKAIEFLDKALAINEKNIVIQLMKAGAYEGMSSFENAENVYKKVISLFPDMPFAKTSYAQFLVKQNRAGEAEQQMRMIAKAEPSNVQAKLDVVRFLIAIKGAAAGQAELESYVKNEPENYELAFALLDLYQAQKNGALEDQLLAEIAKKAGDTAEGFKARSLIARKLILTGKKDEAKKLLAAILEVDKTNGSALTLKAGLALEDKNYDSAISDLRLVIKDSPDNITASLMLANAFERSGSPELAEEQYQNAMRVNKTSPNVSLAYSEFLSRTKHADRAEKVLEELLERNPTNAEAMRSLAQYKINRADYAGAQALADTAKKIGNAAALPNEIMGAISSSKNDYETAIRLFKREHEAAPNEMQPIMLIVRTYLAAGKNKEALEFVQSVLTANPNNLQAKMFLGQLYMSNSNVAQATSIFNELIQAQPHNPVAYQQLAIAQQTSKQVAEAEKTINQGLEAVPRDFGLLFIQAGIYEKTGRVDNAITLYETMNKMRPESEIVSNNLANLLLDKHSDQVNNQRAYDLVKSLGNSTIPQFLDTYGWASYRLGKFDEAEKALKVAVEKLPETAIFHYHYAKVLIATKETAKAKQELQKAIKYAASQPFEQKDEANELLKSL